MLVLDNIILDPIAIVLTLFASYFLVKLVSKIIPFKNNKALKILALLPFSLSIGSVDYLGDTNILIVLIFYIVIFQLSFMGKATNKFIISLMFYLLLSSFNLIVSTIFVTNDFKFFPNEEYLYLVKALSWIIISNILLKYMGNIEVKLSKKLWLLLGGLSAGLFFIIIGFSNIGFGALLDIFTDITKPEYVASDYYYEVLDMLNKIGYIIFPSVFLSILALFAAIKVLTKHEELLEKDALENIKENYYKALQREQKTVRTIRHDMKNHLLTVQAMIGKKDYNKANDYLINLTSSSAFEKGRQISKNNTINAILDNKLDLMEEYKIEFDYRISVPEKLEISDIDLSSLLGNALDNAIEANLKADNRKVIFRLRVDKGLFMLQIKNPLGENPLEKNGTFLTTKKDKKHHGIGLSSIRETVLKYGGNISTIVENGMFELVIGIPVN